MAKNKKITSLRRFEALLSSPKENIFISCSKAIEALGQPTFDKVHDYLMKQRATQRTDVTLDDTRITNGLRAFADNINGCFLVDQLVFLELFSNEKWIFSQWWCSSHYQWAFLVYLCAVVKHWRNTIDLVHMWCSRSFCLMINRREKNSAPIDVVLSRFSFDVILLLFYTTL